jgi:hypothetical protein
MLVRLVPPGVSTMTSTVPVPAGDVAVHELAVQLTLVAAVVPAVVVKTTLPPERFDPVTVTVVPPVVRPLLGLIAVTTGRAGGDGTG